MSDKKYQLTITTFEPLAQEEKAELDEARKFGRGLERGMDEPSRYNAPPGMKLERVLNVVLTEDEWARVKKAVIGEF